MKKIAQRGHSRTGILALPVLLACLGMEGCGGAASDLGNVSPGGLDNTLGTGLFRDSNVAGLGYRSGEIEDVTTVEDGPDLAGQFTYTVGAGITFFVGGVALGTAAGQSVLTPMHIVTNGNTGRIDVQNIARFLQMLDLDNDPSNGIVISSAVREVAETWPQVNFQAADLDAELATIMSDVASVDERIPILPDAVTAKRRLDATLMCTYSGAFGGQFFDNTGALVGYLGFLLNGTTGALSGQVFRSGAASATPISGTIPLRFDQQNLASVSVTGRTPGGDEFTFQFTTLNQIDGNWQNLNNSQQGTFSGTRINDPQTPLYLFVGTFAGDDSGIMSFGVLRDSAGELNSINGNIYKPTINELNNFNGRVIGPESASIRTMNVIAGDVKNFTGNIDFDSLTASGDWTQNVSATEVQTGTFTATGCLLN